MKRFLVNTDSIIDALARNGGWLSAAVLEEQVGIDRRAIALSLSKNNAVEKQRHEFRDEKNGKRDHLLFKAKHKPATLLDWKKHA